MNVPVPTLRSLTNEIRVVPLYHVIIFCARKLQVMYNGITIIAVRKILITLAIDYAYALSTLPCILFPLQPPFFST